MLQSGDEQLAWLLILATIPVGLAGLAVEHVFRVIFGRPAYAAVFSPAPPEHGPARTASHRRGGRLAVVPGEVRDAADG